ncbi:unnamed protein product [Porites lobata]|uniref:Uncharacterized protein n=1 Tax=Porites lobata TaxID=104759 RepID=A0ABN8NRN4_9CNID|nr:unnamed protein product [Porites lobata]
MADEYQELTLKYYCSCLVETLSISYRTRLWLTSPVFGSLGSMYSQIRKCSGTLPPVVLAENSNQCDFCRRNSFPPPSQCSEVSWRLPRMTASLDDKVIGCVDDGSKDG